MSFLNLQINVFNIYAFQEITTGIINRNHKQTNERTKNRTNHPTNKLASLQYLRVAVINQQASRRLDSVPSANDVAMATKVSPLVGANISGLSTSRRIDDFVQK